MAPNYLPRQHRYSCLMVFLTALIVLFVLFVLLVGGGVIGGSIFLLALVHYVLWGRAFSARVAGEREVGQTLQRGETLESWHAANTGIPTHTAFLPSDTRRAETGIQCAPLAHDPAASHICLPPISDS